MFMTLHNKHSIHGCVYKAAAKVTTCLIMSVLPSTHINSVTSYKLSIPSDFHLKWAKITGTLHVHLQALSDRSF